MHKLPPTDEMTKAYQTRDASYNGVFYLAVRTTGIFCLPSCPARKPLPENVVFYATVKEALFAGYRPCKRCQPTKINGDMPDWAAQLLAEIENDPSLRIKDGDLRERGLEPATVRRFFMKTFGMTFHAYARARRLGQAFSAIKEGANLDDVVFDHGYESHSGFREAFSRTFGLPPGKSSQENCIQVTWIESPLGPLVAGATEQGICLLEFTDRRMLEAQFRTLQQRFECALVPGNNEHLKQLSEELSSYFCGDLQTFSVKVAYPGTPFQQKVWDELLTIPYGETTSYQELATRLGIPGASRAVGQANGCNRIAILLPCHRVVGKDGKLGGYGGGLWRKKMLLDLEQGKITFEDPAEKHQVFR